MGVWMHGGFEVGMYACLDVQMYGHLDVWMYVMYGWMDGWPDGCMDGWMREWMDVWMYVMYVTQCNAMRCYVWFGMVWYVFTFACTRNQWNVFGIQQSQYDDMTLVERPREAPLYPVCFFELSKKVS